MILPNKPLNNFELEEASKKLKILCFRGVFLLDTLPKKPNNKECGIVMLCTYPVLPSSVHVCIYFE